MFDQSMGDNVMPTGPTITFCVPKMSLNYIDLKELVVRKKQERLEGDFIEEER